MNKYFEIKDLYCGYEKFNINNINFHIDKGKFTGIIGPNGSGKTTLFRGITGELKAKSGLIRLEGESLSEMKSKEKAQKIAIVTQTIESTDISVFDYVLLGRIPYQGRFRIFESEKDYELAEKYMKLTDVWRFKDKMMNELSGGEQQLASIARALTQEPKVLLLDEPTSHLDISHQVQVLNLIQRLIKELGLTVLIIIHDLNLAGEYCDYLIMMYQGEIYTKGQVNDVLTYKNIEDVYKTTVITQKNPLSGKPAVFLVSQEVYERQKLKSGSQ